jgi:hypothetical protein
MRLIRQTLIVWSVSLEKMAAHENDGSPGDGKETWEPLAHRRIDRPQWEQVIMSSVNFRLSRIHIQLNHSTVTHFSGSEPKLCLAAHRLFQIIELIIPQIETNLRSIWLVEALRVSNYTTIRSRVTRNYQWRIVVHSVRRVKMQHCYTSQNIIRVLSCLISTTSSSSSSYGTDVFWSSVGALLANPDHSLVVITDK